MSREDLEAHLTEARASETTNLQIASDAAMGVAVLAVIAVEMETQFNTLPTKIAGVAAGLATAPFVRETVKRILAGRSDGELASAIEGVLAQDTLFADEARTLQPGD